MDIQHTHHYQIEMFADKYNLSMNPTFRKALGLSSLQTGTPIELMLSTSKKREYCYARYLVMRVMKAFGYSDAEIGRMFNHKDHTSVVNGLRRLEEWIGTYDYIDNDIQSIKNSLKQSI